MLEELSVFTKTIDEAVLLELNVAKLYELFSEHFPEDRNFWMKLVSEENNHANLLISVKEIVSVSLEIPTEILPENYDLLKIANQKTLSITEEFIKQPNRKSAFLLAIELEKVAGELHFQNAMNEKPSSELARVYQELNQDDIDHSERIFQYMTEKKI